MKKTVLLATYILFCLSGNSQIKLAGIFGDHMVIQRSQPVPVWGWAAPGQLIRVRFKQQNKQVQTDPQGKWMVRLDAEPAGGPFELRINDTLVVRDVMIGEVWLCSGQSNMEFELSSVRNATAEIKAAAYPEIRQIKVARRVSPTPKDDIPAASWQICSPYTAENFTAVGYFFARELVKRLHVPVGLINSSWGGTMVETWTSRGAFEKSPEFREMINSLPVMDFEGTVKQRKENLNMQIRNLQVNIRDSAPDTVWKYKDYNGDGWPTMQVSAIWENQHIGLDDLDGVVWFRKEFNVDAASAGKPAELSLGKIDDFDETYINGVLVGSTKNYAALRVYQVPAGLLKAGKNLIAVRVTDTGGGGGFYEDSTTLWIKTAMGKTELGDNWHFRVDSIFNESMGTGPNDFPCLLFNAMINPLIPYGIRGALWYQGEANADRAFQYRTAFPLMITDWRQQWGEGNFPFYFVQLASFSADNGNSNEGSTWAELREAQTRTLALPATGMAVLTDIGESNDIHPKNKQDVGARLAAIALNNIYGQTMEYSGPVYDSMYVRGNKIFLQFSHTGSGLVVKSDSSFIACNWDTARQEPVAGNCPSIGGFEVAGDDRKFYPASAYILGNRVIVFSKEVASPVAVRFAWADDAKAANLFNREGFPAVPFRTDQWKGITDDKKFSVR